MKVLYVAKHLNGQMDDEGSIAHALRVMGHEVRTRNENDPPDGVASFTPDFLLVHKPRQQDWGWLEAYRGVCPRVCWYFDRVADDDQFTADRTVQRTLWMRGITPQLDRLFCTDGDWVRSAWMNQEDSPSCYYLPQGFDERLLVAPLKNDLRHRGKILLTCNDRGSRARFVRLLKDRYGPRLQHHARGLYRSELAWAVRECGVVVAPDGPVSDNYCSNRAYTALGLGGYLIHPYSTPLATQYVAGRDYAPYADDTELCKLIDNALVNPTEVKEVARCGRQHTTQHHLYRHRLEKMLEVLGAIR